MAPAWARARALGAALQLLLLCVFLLVGGAQAKERHWKEQQRVPLIANKVGPYNNPTETYLYYSLPFCRSEEGNKRHKQAMGETLAGDRKVVARLYELDFMVDVPWRKLCVKKLTPEELKQFSDAVEDQFYFEMFVDDLPLYGHLGEIVGEELNLKALRSPDNYKVNLFPHLSFTIGYQDDQIVSVNVALDPTQGVDITDTSKPKEVQFSYSVKWVEETTLTYETRMTRYADSRFLPATFEIHWLSVINSFVLVLLLTAFLTIILMRVLKNDFSRYLEVDEEDLGEQETGWKLVHGDVFRFPKYVNLFSSMVGTGAHLCLVTILLLMCAILGVFKPTKRGSILTCIILLYMFTAFVGGHVSARFYRQMGGKNWVWNTVCTSLCFPLPLFCVFLVLNSIAWHNASTAALPVTTTLAIAVMWLLIAFPLTVVGAILGRNTAGDFQAPCRTTKVPREVPKDIPWFRQAPAQMAMSGFLPFSAIYIELHYIFASVWGHKIYTLFGILILAFFMLLIVCSFITVALIYFQLASEDHRWWWRSFFSGGSTGLFIYAYSFFYFFNRSVMEGFLQGSFYFGYMAVISYSFALMLGFVGFISSLTFVKHIYAVVKIA